MLLISREQLEQEIGKFTIIEKDGLIIGCAALYPYPEERKAEMACVAIHPDYRDGNRGLLLLNYMKHRSKSETIDQIFVLTTHSLHWFREQGFYVGPPRWRGAADRCPRCNALRW